MIIFTEPGDTPQQIAKNILGYYDESYAKLILDANRNSSAYKLMNGCGVYAPNRAVWLPNFSLIDHNSELRDQLLHRTDFIPSHGRANLVKLQKSNVNLNNLLGGAKCASQANRSNRDESSGIIASLAGNSAFESVHRGFEHATRPAESFSHHMKELNTKLKVLVSARNSGEHATIQSARTEYQSAYKRANEAFNKDAKLYARRLSKKGSKYLMSAKHSELVAYKKGIMVNDLNDVQTIGKIARYGKIAGRGMFWFSAILGVDEVYNTYEHGGDAFKKGVGVATELTVAYTLGEFCLLFTPAGWVALAVVAVAEGLGMTFLGKYSDEFGEYVASESEDAYSWLKRDLSHWL